MRSTRAERRAPQKALTEERGREKVTEEKATWWHVGWLDWGSLSGKTYMLDIKNIIFPSSVMLHFYYICRSYTAKLEQYSHFGTIMRSWVDGSIYK